MTAHEIRPKQLRALLLLLVLVPLIPAALMIRFMLDTVRVERLSTLDRFQQLHGETLRATLRNVPDPAGASDGARAESIIRAIDSLADPTISSRVIASSGTVLAGNSNPWGQVLAQAPTQALPGATVQLYLAGPWVIDEAIADQRQSLARVGLLTIIGVLTIAALAAWTLYRQIAIRDLKSTSVATVAHELRTPLASIRMLVDTLREGRYRSETQLREYLDLVAVENERLSRLAESFLTFSRLERGNASLVMAPVSVNALIERAIAQLGSRLELPTCNFARDIAPDLPSVRGDIDALSQVIINLLDNALKYSEPPARIQLTARAKDGKVNISVGDEGIGIPASERKAIFDPFYQVDRKLSRQREGCGLGLSIVKGIVDAHGGSIDIESSPGKGTVFTIQLPTA